ncbi:MAG: hypothetical protein D6753_03380 [Planctomycetota bacterium]|nr:MAG: hypothetical protein D6753_03380 [Planctomycetota bacterium]
MCVSLVPQAQAQQSNQPVALISIAPLDGVLNNTSYMLRACNVPEMSGLVTIMANQYSQGLDRSKPLGALVTLQDGIPTAMIFLPMVDRDQFFGALAGAGIEPDDLGDGLFEIDTGGQVVYAKHAGNWMFIAQTEDALANVPADPERLLGDLPQRYDLAVRLNVQALPAEMKSMATEQIRIGFERSVAAQANQSPEEAESAREMGEASLKQIEELIRDTEQFILGWKVDSTARKTYLDAAAQFVAGSKLAQQCEDAKSLTTRYGKFVLPDAALEFRYASVINDPTDKAVAKNNLRSSMQQIQQQIENSGDVPEPAVAVLEGLLDSIADVMEKTIDEGVFEGAGSVSLADNTLRVLLGGRLADGHALAAAFKEAIDKVPPSNRDVKVEFDYDSYGGYQLHRISGPIKIADPAARAALGDNLTIILGTADKGYLVVLDPTGDAAARQAIDNLNNAQPEPAVPFDSVVRLQPILQFASAVAPNPIIEQAADVASQSQGNDTISISARLITRGGVYRLSIDEGVLRTIGTAAKAGSGQPQGF